MLRPMFGMGGTEIIVILIVALLFLGPDKLPEAAKSISRGIRDIKKQSRVLQQTIEDDEHIGGAIRDLKSALRGEDMPIRPPKSRYDIEATATAAATISLPEPASSDASSDSTASTTGDASDTQAPSASSEPGTLASTEPTPGEAASSAPEPESPKLSFPPTAGEPDADVPASTASDDAELAALIKPAPNTISRGTRGGNTGSDDSHG